ncbi:MAG: peptidase S24 [Bacteroidales bacterium]|jgi:SOS-response transcriptional repressor LexA|nr:peptidase S24 [Bacteroidales bacterium]
MDKNLTIKDRILYFLENQGIKKTDFYEKTDISASNFKGAGLNSELGGDKIVKILTVYSLLSPEWLLTGEGQMLKPAASPSGMEGDGIPLIPDHAMAGIFQGDISVAELDCERYVVPVFKGADFLIPVKGSSMYPKYSSGDIVACKKIPLNDLFFQWNKVYVLDTVQGPLIKRIGRGSDPDHILVVSENTKYEPFELHISQLRAVAIVLGVIRLE